jgi:hypothetical protein
MKYDLKRPRHIIGLGPKPKRTVVGSDYYFASGVVRSNTQYGRMKRDGRISPPFKIGSRDAQFKDVADADIARLTGQGEDTAA